MEYVKLVNGLSISKVSLGTYPLDGNILIESIESATSCGYGIIDTAIGYGNNAIIGDCVSSPKKMLESVLVSTKIDGYTLRKMALPRSLKRFAGYKELSFIISNSLIDNAIEQSFNSLRRIDIMLLHAPYRGCLKVYDAIAKLYEEKKIKAFGVSNFDIRELELLYKERGEYPMINQTEISPYNSQKELIGYCKEHNIIVEAYSPFGRGKLINEFMTHPKLVEIGFKYKKTVGQIILKWIVQQGMIVVVRSQNRNRIQENANLFDFELDELDMRVIDGLNKDLVFGSNQIGKASVKHL
jgi:diketogulonate reductase-like aldo/keto reductase